MQRVGQRVHVLAELDQVVTYRTHRLPGDRIAQSLLFLRPASIASKAKRWVTSSCNARANRARSSS